MLPCCSGVFGTIPYPLLGKGVKTQSRSVWLKSKCLFGSHAATLLCGPS